MKTLCVAIGNTLRGDDGVAHRVAALLDAGKYDILHVHQLTPEVAADIAKAHAVVFMDAYAGSGEPHLEEVPRTPVKGSPLGHAMTPPEVLALAAALFGFSGNALLCRIPVSSFEQGDRLSSIAETNAERAALLFEGATRGL